MWLKVLLVSSSLILATNSFAAIDEELEQLSSINSSDSTQAFQLIQELEVKLPDFEHNDQRAKFYIQKAYYYMIKGELLRAQKSLNQLLELANVSPRYKVVAYNFHAHIEMRNGFYQKAFQYLMLSSDLMPFIKSSEVKFNFYHSTASIFLHMEEYEEAENYAKKASVVAQSFDNQEESCYAKALELELAIYADKSINFDSLFSQVDSICDDSELSIVKGNVLKNKGAFYFKNKLYTSAEKHLTEALSLTDVTQFRDDYLRIQLLLAKVLFEQKKFTESLGLVGKILQHTEGRLLSKSRRDAFYLLSELETEHGNYREANGALVEYNKINELLLKDLSDRNLAYQIVQYSNKEQEAEVEILDQRNKLLELEATVNAQSKQNLQLLFVLALVLLSAIAVWLWRIKVQKDRYQLLSQRDALTGVLSRRYILHMAQTIDKDSRQKNQDYSVVMFDIDHFKTFNDRFGHAIGDWVLQQVAQQVSQVIRKEDLFGRIGGEEFLLVLPHTSKQDAKKFAQRCRDLFRTITHQSFNSADIITASFGVVDKNDGNNVEELLLLADDAMYKAKQLGRDQAISH